MPDNTEALPPLPEKRWAGFCGKCNSVTKFQERPNTKAAPCGRCGYATFCEELDYSDDEMRDYARAALAQRQQVPDEPTLDRESTWWALAMGAAASLENAANGMRDPDAEKAALGAAAHVRRQCAALTAAPSAQAERRVECDACPTALGCLGKCMKATPPVAQAEPQVPLPYGFESGLVQLLNEARCLEGRIVGNRELASRIVDYIRRGIGKQER